jgi:hypothetical protein
MRRILLLVALLGTLFAGLMLAGHGALPAAVAGVHPNAECPAGPLC